MRSRLLLATAALAVVAALPSAKADMAAAERWINSEFQPSALSVGEQ
jgi:glycerol transport system substrate-binding protein